LRNTYLAGHQEPLFPKEEKEEEGEKEEERKDASCRIFG
jgi:hypothetical protein